MAEKNKIPIIVMEEHKEAYYVWHIFSEMGRIGKFQNILLHVDHHEDNLGGVYNVEIDKLPKDLEFSKYLSYEEFGIANFIVPAVYERMFTKWICVLRDGYEVHTEKKYFGCRQKEVGGKRKSVLSELVSTAISDEEKKLIEENEKKGLLSDVRVVDWLAGGLGEYGDFSAPVVLDIDLDYFCWSDTLKNGVERTVEITAQAWEKFKENPYDCFRVMPDLFIRIYESGGKYYLTLLNNRLYTEEDEEMSEKILLERLDKFFAWLKKQKFVPAAIDICRSRISGYLNTDYFPLVENEVLRRLDELYGTEVLFRPEI